MTDYSERYDDYAIGSPQDEKPPGYEEPAADTRSQVCSLHLCVG
jgi:hypothetical protein